jgi:hypothetical protein
MFRVMGRERVLARLGRFLAQPGGAGIKSEGPISVV